MAPKRRYTDADRLKVRRLVQLGLNDIEISKKTGFSLSWVANQTTNYWKQKMLNKYGK